MAGKRAIRVVVFVVPHGARPEVQKLGRIDKAAKNSECGRRERSEELLTGEQGFVERSCWLLELFAW